MHGEWKIPLVSDFFKPLGEKGGGKQERMPPTGGMAGYGTRTLPVRMPLTLKINW